MLFVLPIEVLERICSYLQFSVVLSVSLTNSRFKDILYNERIWKNLYQNRFLETSSFPTPSSPRGWKKAYQSRLETCRNWRDPPNTKPNVTFQDSSHFFVAQTSSFQKVACSRSYITCYGIGVFHNGKYVRGIVLSY